MSSPFLKDGTQYHENFNEISWATGDHYLETSALDTRSLMLCGSNTQCDVLKKVFKS